MPPAVANPLPTRATAAARVGNISYHAGLAILLLAVDTRGPRALALLVDDLSLSMLAVALGAAAGALGAAAAATYLGVQLVYFHGRELEGVARRTVTFGVDKLIALFGFGVGLAAFTIWKPLITSRGGAIAAMIVLLLAAALVHGAEVVFYNRTVQRANPGLQWATVVGLYVLAGMLGCAAIGTAHRAHVEASHQVPPDDLPAESVCARCGRARGGDGAVSGGAPK